MKPLRRGSTLIAGALVFGLCGPSAAQQHEYAGNPAPAAPYRAGLGDLMTVAVQPRHIKLGLAGAAGNWAYAAYELKELQQAFDKIAAAVPKHGKLMLAEAFASTVKPPMEMLDAAIKATDAPAFAKAYGDLTAGCNACHQSGDHPVIVINVPTVSGTAFPDQDFSAPKK